MANNKLIFITRIRPTAQHGPDCVRPQAPAQPCLQLRIALHSLQATICKNHVVIMRNGDIVEAEKVDGQQARAIIDFRIMFVRQLNTGWTYS